MSQVTYICELVNAIVGEDGNTMKDFTAMREQFESTRRYQPRIVLDDEQDPDYDDDEGM